MGEEADNDETATDLLAIIVKALEPYDIPTDRWSKADREEPAAAVLAVLGLEQVGSKCFHGVSGANSCAICMDFHRSVVPVYTLNVGDGPCPSQPSGRTDRLNG